MTNILPPTPQLPGAPAPSILPGALTLPAFPSVGALAAARALPGAGGTQGSAVAAAGLPARPAAAFVSPARPLTASSAPTVLLAPALPVTAPVPPLPPTGVSAAGGLKQNIITWINGAGATGANIYWKLTTGVTIANGTKIANVTSPYTQTGLADNTEYYYIVTSTNDVGGSSPSGEVSATTSVDFAAWTGTLSAINCSSHINLSGANLIATQAGVAYFVSVVSSALKSAGGKWAAKFTITNIGAGALLGIFANSSNPFPSDGAIIGSDAFGYGYKSDGTKEFNGANGAYGAAFTTGDVILMLFDDNAGTLEMLKNNVSQGVMYVGINGALNWAAAMSLNNGAVVTVDFTATH